MSIYDEIPVSRARDTQARYLSGAGVERELRFPFKGSGVGWEEMTAALLTDGRVLVYLPPSATALGRVVLDVGFFATIAREFGEGPRP